MQEPSSDEGLYTSVHEISEQLDIIIKEIAEMRAAELADEEILDMVDLDSVTTEQIVTLLAEELANTGAARTADESTRWHDSAVDREYSLSEPGVGDSSAREQTNVTNVGCFTSSYRSCNRDCTDQHCP